MDRLIYTAASAARALLQRQELLANNVANANTPGFRADNTSFRTVTIEGEGLATRHAAMESGPGIDERTANIETTSRSLDVAVVGRGYMTVRAPDGSESYTRAGAFTLGPDGTLLAPGGFQVLGEGGPIQVAPGSAVHFNEDGTVTARLGEGPAVVAGRLKLVDPPPGQMLKGPDGLLYMPGREPAEASNRVRLAPGALEGSNVSLVTSLVDMISASRAFETQMKLLQNADQNDQRASQLLAQPR